ncbi:MAG: CDP-glycerol glycerophosphotransferase family protein [Planctomycetota bacterium]
MRRKRLLFFAKCPMNFVLFEPVYGKIADHEQLEFHFTGKYQGHKDPALVYKTFDLRGGRLVRNSSARWRRYDVYLSPDFRLAGRRAKVAVHMFHGFSLRNFAIQKRALRFDRLFLIGPYMKRRFVEAGLMEEGDVRMEEVGMPKLDPLVNGRYERDRLLEELRLDPSRKTVLFAPTWIEGGCLDQQGREIVQRLRQLDVNTLIKLHDNSFDLRKQKTDWARVLPPILGERQRLVRGFDSNPYLAASDLLISDASSVANEFLVLDRPLIFFRLEHLEDDWPATDLGTWGTRTGDHIEDAAELLDAVPRALEQPDRLSELRQEAARDFFYAPGTAAERAAERLLEYAGLGESRR